MWLCLSLLYEVSRQAVENWVHMLVFLHFYPVIPKPYLSPLSTGFLSTIPCDPCSCSLEHCPAGCQECLHKPWWWNKNSPQCRESCCSRSTNILLQQKEHNSFHLSPCNLKWFPSCASLSWWKHCTTLFIPKAGKSHKNKFSVPWVCFQQLSLIHFARYSDC